MSAPKKSFDFLRGDRFFAIDLLTLANSEAEIDAKTERNFSVVKTDQSFNRVLINWTLTAMVLLAILLGVLYVHILSSQDQFQKMGGRNVAAITFSENKSVLFVAPKTLEDEEKYSAIPLNAHDFYTNQLPPPPGSSQLTKDLWYF